MPSDEARIIRMEVDYEDGQFMAVVNSMRQLLEEFIEPRNYEVWDRSGDVICPYCVAVKRLGNPIEHIKECPVKRAKDLLDSGVNIPLK